jgi:hypothetical protein
MKQGMTHSPTQHARAAGIAEIERLSGYWVTPDGKPKAEAL